jgi:hypothetical protein
MRILVADETNLTPSEKIQFFLYGGAIFDPGSIMEIGNKIREIRSQYKIKPHEKIKFNIHSCPQEVTREQHTEIKNKIIELAAEHKVKVIINCVLHQIAKNKEGNELVEMSSATVFRRFNQFCFEQSEPGIVLADRWPFDDGFSFLESCQFGEITYSSGYTIKLPNIYGYAQVSDNSTVLMSVSDVIIGAFRYCINNREKTIVNTKLMPKLGRLLWFKKEHGVLNVKDRGLNTSPRRVIIPKYRREYKNLVTHIVEYANANL